MIDWNIIGFFFSACIFLQKWGFVYMPCKIDIYVEVCKSFFFLGYIHQIAC